MTIASLDLAADGVKQEVKRGVGAQVLGDLDAGADTRPLLSS